MNKVIVDLCVWYRLGRDMKNGIIHDTVMKDNLKCTHFNIFEVNVTPRHFKGMEIVEVIDGVKSFVKYTNDSSDFVLLHPLEYLVGLEKSVIHEDMCEMMNLVYSIYHDKGKRKWSDIKDITDVFTSETLTPEERTDRIDKQKEFKRDMSNGVSDYFNTNLGVMRNEVQQNFMDKSKNELYDMYLPLVKDIIKELLNSFVVTWGLGPTGTYRVEDIDWEKHHFLISMLTRRYVRKVKEEAKEFEPSDVFDIFQMIYVEPGDYFWTNERKWLILIKEDDSLKKYMKDYMYTLNEQWKQEDKSNSKKQRATV